MGLCQLAAANSLPASIPAFPEPARPLGTYLITDVTSDAKDRPRNVCAPKNENEALEAAALNCGRFVWLVRTDKMLAVLEAPQKFEETSSVQTMTLDGMFIHRKCQTVLSHDQAMSGGIFDGDFCRAYAGKVPQAVSGTLEKFYFNNQVPEIAKLPADYNFLELFSLAMLSRISNKYTIELPRGEASPKSVKIIQEVEGAVVGIPGNFKYTTTLIHASN